MGTVTNKSNNFIIDHDTASQQVEPQSDALVRTFTQSSKEKSFLRTNASDINFLNSVKTLEVQKGDENPVLPCKKTGVDQKLNLNQSKAYVNVSASE